MDKFKEICYTVFMDTIISSLVLWIAPASLLWVVLNSKWLNARALAAGRLAEGIAWMLSLIHI